MKKILLLPFVVTIACMAQSTGLNGVPGQSVTGLTSSSSNRFNYCFGDSTMTGLLGTTIYQNGLCPRLASDSSGTTLNYAVGGTFMSQIAAATLFYAPLATPLNGSTPPTIFMNGGINDANTSVTTGAEAVYQDSLMGALAFETMPTANKLMASTATATGTWAADSTDLPLNAGVTGTAMKSTVNASTLTFSIPAGSGKVGISWVATTSGTGTFTFSIDGTNQTSTTCSLSTTFTNSSCSSVAPQAITVLREEFTVAAGTHTGVVTVTSSGQPVVILDVDTNPSTTSSQTLAMMSGVLYQNADADSSATAAYNTLASNVVSALIAENLNIVFANVRGSNPGVNSTTDMSATSGIGGNSPLHPNDAGYLHYAQTYERAATAVRINQFFPAISAPTPPYYGANYLNPQAQVPTSAIASPTINYYAVGNNYAGAGLAVDVNFSNSFANTLFAGTSFGFSLMNCSTVSSGIPTYSSCTDAAHWDSSGNQTNKGGIKLATARKGTFVCTAAGTITIANALELVTSDVVISLNVAGGTITTSPAMKTVTSGTGFTVLCGASDTSTYNYDILN